MSGEKARPLAPVLICVALGTAGLGLALRNGGLLAWLLAGFLVLGVRLQLRPRPGDLKLVLRTLAAFVASSVLVAAGMVGLWESAEVIVLRQRDENGERFSTRLWVVDLDGYPSFLARPPSEHRRIALLRAHPRVELVRHGRPECRRAVLVSPSDAVRSEATRLYEEKYGARVYFAGRLVGVLLGGRPRASAPEILVRLEPCAGGAA